MSDLAVAAEDEPRPEAKDYEAHIADLSGQLEKARAEIAEFKGPQYAGLCQFRAADGRICLTLYADGRIEKGEGFPDDDQASAAFFDSMAKNLKGHMQDRENRVIAAEAAAAAHDRAAMSVAQDNATLRQRITALESDLAQARHQSAVSAAKAEALLEARGKP